MEISWICIIMARSSLRRSPVPMINVLRPLANSEEKVYLEDSQIQQLFTDPEQFKGKYAKLSGVLLANPEADSDGSMALQIFYDTQNYDQNFIVYTDNADSSLKSGDYVKVDGKVRGKFTGQNAMGAEISIPAIENAAVTKSTYMDVVAPKSEAKRS